MNLTDEQREQAIADQARKIEEAFARGDMEQARVCKETMRVLIAGRSEKWVARMEEERGLNG